jgi:hypothetical protein
VSVAAQEYEHSTPSSNAVLAGTLCGTRTSKLNAWTFSMPSPVTLQPRASQACDNLTHVLRYDEQAPSIFRYAELASKPVEPEVLALITRWHVSRQ